VTDFESPTKKIKPSCGLEQLCTIDTVPETGHSELDKEGKC